MAGNLIGGLRISGVFQSDELDSLHIAGRNDAPLLRDILDKAIADIGREERRTIMARWLPTVALEQQQAAGAEGGIELSPGERAWVRSEEHTSELQSLMRSSYAVFCLKKQNN